MSRHFVTTGDRTWVFGWDQMLQSFFLQVHDERLPEDENPVVWLGTAGSEMYEVDDLIQVAKKHGLEIDRDMWVTLYKEKDDGV